MRVKCTLCFDQNIKWSHRDLPDRPVGLLRLRCMVTGSSLWMMVSALEPD
jgi:hypothetical protein